jgi:uncharacterized protein (TIGR03118 family)
VNQGRRLGLWGEGCLELSGSQHGCCDRSIIPPWLVSDLPGLAQLTDPDLVNPWGLAAGPATPAWVADNGTDKATIYPGFVHGSPITKAPLVVNIPGGAPTGQVFNPTPGFEVHSGPASGPALFLFDSEAGLVSGWNPGVPRPRPRPRPRSALGSGTPSSRA